MQDIDIIFSVIILIMSVVVHEVMHGYAALSMGDHTAEHAGRLSLNPVKHIDPVGSIALPAALALLKMPMIGWAKPVPYNEHNLSDKRWGSAKVALAGPVSNLVLALIFGLLLRYFAPFWYELGVSNLLYLIVLINVFLAVFNLVPIPPLDGSKVLFAFLPYRYRHIQAFLEQYALYLVIIFVFFLWDKFAPIAEGLVRLITGI